MQYEPETRTVGAWLAAAALLLIAALALHPPPETGTEAFMDQIAAEGSTWIVAHGLAAAALASFVVAGLLGLTAAGDGLTRSAFGIMVGGASLTLVTAVAEATVVATAAADGDLATFTTWDAFAGGMSMGFVGLALGVAGIAFGALRRESPVPRWSARMATGASVVAAAAWILGTGVGVTGASPVWLVTSLVSSAWLVWYGIASVRKGTSVTHRRVTHA